MHSQDQNHIPTGLYYAALGKTILDYTGRLHPAVLQHAMESRAIQTLEAIRCILENDALDDPDCIQRIDSLIKLFYQELDIKIRRHADPD